MQKSNLKTFVTQECANNTPDGACLFRNERPCVVMAGGRCSWFESAVFPIAERGCRSKRVLSPKADEFGRKISGATPIDDAPAVAEYLARVPTTREPTKAEAEALRTIYEKCVTCQNRNSFAIDVCEQDTCPLWPFRFGKCPTRAETPLQAIRRLCVEDCWVGETKRVDYCLSATCPLWPLRFGLSERDARARFGADLLDPAKIPPVSVALSELPDLAADGLAAKPAATTETDSACKLSGPQRNRLRDFLPKGCGEFVLPGRCRMADRCSVLEGRHCETLVAEIAKRIGHAPQQICFDYPTQALQVQRIFYKGKRCAVCGEPIVMRKGARLRLCAEHRAEHDRHKSRQKEGDGESAKSEDAGEGCGLILHLEAKKAAVSIA